MRVDAERATDLVSKGIRGLAQLHDAPLVDLKDHDLDVDFHADHFFFVRQLKLLWDDCKKKAQLKFTVFSIICSLYINTMLSPPHNCSHSCFLPAAYL
jgi:hypothetical protein